MFSNKQNISPQYRYDIEWLEGRRILNATLNGIIQMVSNGIIRTF